MILARKHYEYVIFWDVIQCSPVEVRRRFRATSNFHGRRVSQQEETGGKLNDGELLYQTARRHIPEERYSSWLTSVITSNPTVFLHIALELWVPILNQKLCSCSSYDRPVYFLFSNFIFSLQKIQLGFLTGIKNSKKLLMVSNKLYNQLRGPESFLRSWWSLSRSPQGSMVMHSSV
jgi:hypothetical protein